MDCVMLKAINKITYALLRQVALDNICRPKAFERGLGVTRDVA